MKRPELIKIAKDMKLQGYTQLKKAQLIELIKNPPLPPPPPAAPSDDVLKEIKSMKVQQLRNKAKEMGLQRYTFLNKKELLELITNPIAPRNKYRGIKTPVTLIKECRKCSSHDEKFFFPSINQAAKYFNINPGILGAKFYVKSEEARNSIEINGIVYKLEID